MTDKADVCPFCGWNEATMKKRPWQVECALCLAEGPRGETREDAVARWNKRMVKTADLRAEVERLRAAASPVSELTELREWVSDEHGTTSTGFAILKKIDALLARLRGGAS